MCISYRTQDERNSYLRPRSIVFPLHKKLNGSALHGGLMQKPLPEPVRQGLPAFISYQTYFHHFLAAKAFASSFFCLRKKYSYTTGEAMKMDE